MNEIHKLLERLLHRHFPEDVDRTQFEPLIESLSDTFAEFDEDRYMLERSLRLTSNELNEINETLREQLRENQNAKIKVEENLAKQKALLDATPEAVFSFLPGGKISQVNRAALDLLQMDEKQLFAKSDEENLRAWMSRLKNPQAFNHELDKIKADPSLELHGYAEMKDGSFYEYNSVAEFLEEQYLGRVWCWRDITEMKKHQEKLRYQAFHDSLTGLPNRLFLLESIFHAINLARRNETIVAVMFIDLDDFKKINDTAGHEVGDRFLIEAAKKIECGLREGDILGRLGGDEFLILLEGIRSQYEITNVKERILELLTTPIVLDGNEYVVSCSIGISLFPNDGAEPDELVRKADMAMYQAKRSGKNTFRFFDPSLEAIALHRLSIETKLRAGIENQEFSLVYQPKIEIDTGNLKGVEALIRWVKPDGELVYPEQFINIAENIGLIQRITQWVINEACSKVASWQGTPLEDVCVSVNISALDFSDEGFSDFVEDVLEAHAIDTSLIEFELTESVFLEEKTHAKNVITRLKRIGVKLSIDDFGTGYSSFSYLQELDIDYLKIDRSFIANRMNNPRSSAIVKSIVDVGMNLGMDVIAEGVETEEELKLVKNVGCNLCQGFYFSKPLSEESLLEYFEKNHEYKQKIAYKS